jgi:hypothetical protein
MTAGQNVILGILVIVVSAAALGFVGLQFGGVGLIVGVCIGFAFGVVSNFTWLTRVLK